MRDSFLTPAIAQRIVDRTMAVIDTNVNVMDAAGRIIGSGQADRVGTVHEGAVLAAQQNRTVVIHGGETQAMRGAQPGVNQPLYHHGELVGVVGISGEPDAVRAQADLIGITAELIVDQAHALDSGRWRERETEEYVVAMATGTVQAGPASTRWAQDIGVNLDLPRSCTVVVAAAGSAHGDPFLINKLHRRLTRLGTELLVGRTEPAELAIWWPDKGDGQPPAPLVRALHDYLPQLRWDHGPAASGPSGLRQAWLVAHDAVRVRRLSDRLPEGIHADRDLPLLALLATLRSHPMAETLSRPWQRLVAQDQGDLVTTLGAWLANGQSPSRSSHALHIHRNTLRHRLDKIAHVTGLDLSRLPDLIQLYLGAIVVADDRDDAG